MPVEKEKKPEPPPVDSVPLPDVELDAMDEEVIRGFETHPRPN